LGFRSDDTVGGGSFGVTEGFWLNFEVAACSAGTGAVDRAEGFGLVLGVTFRSDTGDFGCLLTGSSSTFAFFVGERGFGGSDCCNVFSF
jgi:hypothetical protein